MIIDRVASRSSTRRRSSCRAPPRGC